MSDDRRAAHWERLIARLLKFGGASAGNSVSIFCDGDQAFEAIWAALDGAARRIWFETYIFEPDRVGRRTLQGLTSAAERGCEVRLLYDGLGSPRLTDAHLAPLRAAGGVAVAFNPLRFRLASLLRRDHRKIIVVDDHTAFCGGMNVAEEYAGHSYGSCLFRDSHMRLRGPCVRDLARVFLNSLRRTEEGRRLAMGPLPPHDQRAGDMFVQVLASSGGAQGRRSIQRALRMTIRNAASHCYITTPYFIPPPRLRRAMLRAARRGVDVRVLTAGRCDVPAVRLAAQHIYGQLLHRGVRIYELFSTTLHAKIIEIDGVYSTVGSFNLDTWSDKRNLEVNVGIVDSRVARELHDEFQRTTAQATEITLETWRKRPWYKRLLHWAVYQLMQI